MDGGAGLAVDPIDRLGDGEAGVLRLERGAQGLGVRGLDPHQEVLEARGAKERQELLVLRDVEGDAGRELERLPVALQPAGELAEQGLGLRDVAHQVVVEEVDLSSVAEPVQRLDLGEDLRRALGAVAVVEQVDDVAEFAVVGAPPRELDRHVEVVPVVHQIEPGDGRPGEVRGAPRLVDPGGDSPGEIGEKPGEGELGLAQAEGQGTHAPVQRGVQRGVRSSDHHHLLQRHRLADDRQSPLPVDDLAPHQDQIRPVEVRVLQRTHVLVHQPELPVGREECGHGEQPERWGHVLHPHQLADPLEVPEGEAAELGPDQQCASPWAAAVLWGSPHLGDLGAAQVNAS